MPGALSANDTDKLAMPGSASFQTDCWKKKKKKEGKARAEIIAGASSESSESLQAETNVPDFILFLLFLEP